jgi:hypothetical protein
MLDVSADARWLAAYALGVAFNEADDGTAIVRLRALEPDERLVRCTLGYLMGFNSADGATRARAVRLLEDLVVRAHGR